MCNEPAREHSDVRQNAGSIGGGTISWLRTRALPRQIVTADGPYGLGRQAGYFAKFTAADEHMAWRRPWIGDESYSYFWARNLGQNYRMSSADKAWKRQVPLREAAPPTLSTTESGVAVRCDRFAYPTGVGVVVTADLAGPLDAADLLELAASLNGNKIMAVAGSAQPKTMTAMLGDLLDGAERAVLSDTDPNAVGDLKPTTVATVTATTDWPWAPVVQADAVHRLLEGLCRLNVTPLASSVGDLKTASLNEAGSYPGTSRFAVARGRAIWSPNQSCTLDGAHRLGCYHQNQTLATLQAGVLLDTTRWVSGQQVPGLGEDVKGLLRPVVNVLGLLYGKVGDMYASAFIRRQINDSDLVPLIGDLRIALGVGGALQ